MTEIVLAFTNLLFALAILGYFYFKEVYTKKDDTARIEKLDSFYSKTLEQVSLLSQYKDDLMQKTLMEYLKHNEKLERMVLPQPVTKKAVQDVLDSLPNEIEKNDEDLEREQLENLLARVPITKDTKVAFEGFETGEDNGLAEEVISDSGKFN